MMTVWQFYKPQTSGALIRKLTDVPITDILAVVISNVATDTDIKQ